MRIDVNIDSKDIVSSLKSYFSREELIDFIKELDGCVAEYDFTEKLRNYFVEEIKKEDEQMTAWNNEKLIKLDIIKDKL